MPTVTVATSPLNCRWIVPGSRRVFESFEYAVCRRPKHAERVVNEAECRYCLAWEPPCRRGERPLRKAASRQAGSGARDRRS